MSTFTPATTKVREGDWVSVDKAIRRLKSSTGGNSTVNVKNYYVTGTMGGQGDGGAELKNVFIEIVADEAARLALEAYVARLCFQRDEGVLFLYSTY